MFKKVLGNLFLSSTKYFIAICVMTQAICSDKEEEKTSTSPHSSMISEAQTPYFGNSQFLPNFTKIQGVSDKEYIGNPAENQFCLKEYRKDAWNFLTLINENPQDAFWNVNEKKYLKALTALLKDKEHYIFAKHEELVAWFNHFIEHMDHSSDEFLQCLNAMIKHLPSESLLSITQKNNKQNDSSKQIKKYTIAIVPVYNENEKI